jgi:HK97 family phage prohead protease
MFVPYNSEARPFENRHCVELFGPRAFRGSLASGEHVSLLIDHEPAQQFATTADGTLAVAENDDGLIAQLTPFDDATRDLVERAERCGFRGVSVGFYKLRGDWSEDRRRHTVHEAVVYEVTLATKQPACPQAAYRVIRE